MHVCVFYYWLICLFVSGWVYVLIHSFLNLFISIYSCISSLFGFLIFVYLSIFSFAHLFLNWCVFINSFSVFCLSICSFIYLSIYLFYLLTYAFTYLLVYVIFLLDLIVTYDARHARSTYGQICTNGLEQWVKLLLFCVNRTLHLRIHISHRLEKACLLCPGKLEWAVTGPDFESDYTQDSNKAAA